MGETVQLVHFWLHVLPEGLSQTQAFGAGELILFIDISASQPREGETIHPFVLTLSEWSKPWQELW